ncbi:uncharacterized protein [Cherax quadricarinatus]
MSPDDIGPLRQRPTSHSLPSETHSSPPNVPLGVPGFIFPKLPNLKKNTGIVNATAFAKMGNVNLGSVPRDVPEAFFGLQKGELLFPQRDKHEDLTIQPLGNQYPSSPVPTPSTTRFTSLSATLTPPPGYTFAPEYSLSSSSQTFNGPTGPSTPVKTTVAIISEVSLKPKQDLTHTKLEKTHWTSPKLPTSYQPTTRSTQPTSVKPITPFTMSIKQQQPITRNAPPKSSGISNPAHTYGIQISHHSHYRKPEVITASSLPRLPSQVSSAFQEPFSGRQTTINVGPATTTTPTRTTEESVTTLDENFAQNFGFDPESVVYESDFRPIKKKTAGPLLAFEVSSSDVMPIRVPRPPHPPQHTFQQRPVGPRTSGSVSFAQRRIKIDDDTDETHDEDASEIPNEKRSKHFPNPIFHDSVMFSESLNPPPVPIPVPMARIVPRLGGAASNRPFFPNKLIKHDSNRNPNGPKIHDGSVRPSGGVDRMGKPQVQKPSMRRITAMVHLPDDHTVPFPQLVGPEVFKPVLINFPLEHDDGEDMMVAESAQVFTSDGRPLEPDTLPTPPQFSTGIRRTVASIINRPKIGPFRGDRPPPVPAHVPHLTQFSRQRRPFRHRTTIALPSPHGVSSTLKTDLLPSGSAPRPITIAHPQNDPPIAAALLTSGKLSADVGDNVVVSVRQYPRITEMRNSTLSPTAVSSAATNQTHLTILKDVWSILTRDDLDFKPEHPRDDAHPDHDHLDRQERSRRYAAEPSDVAIVSDTFQDSVITSEASAYSLSILVVCIGAIMIMVLIR